MAFEIQVCPDCGTRVSARSRVPSIGALLRGALCSPISTESSGRTPWAPEKADLRPAAFGSYPIA